MRIFGSKLSPSTNTYIEAELAFVALQYDWPTSFDPTMVKLFLLRDFVKKYSSNGNFLPRHWNYIHQSSNCLR